MLQERNLYEMHLHTAEASVCAEAKAADGIRAYYEKGYKGIFVTEHYQENFFDRVKEMSHKDKIDKLLSGYRIMKEEAKKYNMDVFLGMEFRELSNMNDFLIYGLTEEFYYENENLYLLKIDEAAKLFRDAGAAIIQAHPFRASTSFLSNPANLHGIEIHNGNSRHLYDSRGAAEAVKKYGFTGISGSDFHILEDLATGGTVFYTEIKSQADIVERLITGKVDEVMIDTDALVGTTFEKVQKMPDYNKKFMKITNLI